MKERDLQSILSRLIPAYLDYSAAFELKMARTNSLPFSALLEHQEHSLLTAKNSKVFFKIPDLGNSNPFDCFMLAHVPSFVVICYYIPRQPKEFLFLDIEKFVDERDHSARKSLTKQRAIEISSLILKA